MPKTPGRIRDVEPRAASLQQFAWRQGECCCGVSTRVLRATDMKLVYLACPYTHNDRAIAERRAKIASYVAAKLMQHGFVVFSPLSHSTAIAPYLKNHFDHKFWLTQDLPWLLKCDILIVLCLPGWSQSFGVSQEINTAIQHGIPIKYVHVKEQANAK